MSTSEGGLRLEMLPSANHIRSVLGCGRCSCVRGKLVHCPAHDPQKTDKTPSLSVKEAEAGKILLHCFNGCSQETVISALRELGLWYSPNGGGERGGMSTPIRDATLQRREGLTLEQYAADRRLPLDMLREMGLSTITYENGPAVRIPFLSPQGETTATQYRIDRSGEKRWKAKDKPTLYGLDRLEDIKKEGWCVLGEGASDGHTMRANHIPYIGLPSAQGWDEAKHLHYFEHIGTVLVVIEPDSGGRAVELWLANSELRHKVQLIEMPDGFNDPSEMWMDDPALFAERWQQAIANAAPWALIERQRREEGRADSWELCKDIATQRNILDTFAKALPQHKLVGEDRTAKVAFLAMVSRLLDDPVKLLLKGPSSGGKSFIVKVLVRFFPEDCYEALSGLSDRALAYSDADYRHKVLIIYEWEGMKSDMASYMLRTLLSEGHIKYRTNIKTSNGIESKLIEKEGPTGCIVTTTATSIHPENETRHLSINVIDTQEQTKSIMRELAREDLGEPEMIAWTALQWWLGFGSVNVTLPFAPALAEAIPPVAVRLRRDFKEILSLLKTHAILHQHSRQIDSNGRIIATLDDYDVIKDLIDGIVSEGVGRTVKQTTRETVEAVSGLINASSTDREVKAAELCGPLKLDKASVSRRVRVALADGYLKNNEVQRGKPYRLVIGDPMPDESGLMPSREQLEEVMGCVVARDPEGYPTPLPPDDEDDFGSL